MIFSYDKVCGHGHDCADGELGIVTDPAAYDHGRQQQSGAEDGSENG